MVRASALRLEPPETTIFHDHGENLIIKLRQLVRVSILVLTIAYIGLRLPVVIRDFHNWRQALHENDKSAAELYETDLEIEGAGVVFVLGATAISWFALGRER